MNIKSLRPTLLLLLIEARFRQAIGSTDKDFLDKILLGQRLNGDKKVEVFVDGFRLLVCHKGAHNKGIRQLEKVWSTGYQRFS